MKLILKFKDVMQFSSSYNANKKSGKLCGVQQKVKIDENWAQNVGVGD